MKTKNEEIGKRIIDAFLDIGWKKVGIKKRIAIELKVAPPSITKWMNGSAIPTIDKIFLISEITKKSSDWILYGKDSNYINKESFVKIENKNQREINILSYVQAGELTDLSTDEIGEKINVDSQWLSDDIDYFGLYVKGDSMYNDDHPKSLLEGSVVVIDPTKNPEIGDVVVVSTPENTSTIKLLSGDHSCKILKPLNKSYSNISGMNLEFSECNIIGVAIMSVHPPKKL
jgi:SOS-response transcriptional repressor LexA